jgi:D-glycero-alpha-D-manno-heptose-7-phosphate kinase
MGDSWFRASAPVRLDFAGGWTDVAPFTTAAHGAVVNGAIELRVHAEVEPGGDEFTIEAQEIGPLKETFRALPLTQEPGDRLALHKAALMRSGPETCILRTRSGVPAGSGLGSSGALGVALVAALDAAQDRRRTAAELAEAAFQLEVADAGLPGGRQDQYAAALGGFHRFGFAYDAVTIDPLTLDPAFTTELASRIVLCYTGTSRISSNTISRVMGAYAEGISAVTAALHRLVEVAEGMAEALRASDLAATARLLSENWRLQRQLDAGMCTPEMSRLERAMGDVGVLGGKAAGAGAGGSMFFITKDPEPAARAARNAGARVLPFSWATKGVTVQSGA